MRIAYPDFGGPPASALDARMGDHVGILFPDNPVARALHVEHGVPKLQTPREGKSQHPKRAIVTTKNWVARHDWLWLEIPISDLLLQLEKAGRVRGPILCGLAALHRNLIWSSTEAGARGHLDSASRAAEDFRTTQVSHAHQGCRAARLQRLDASLRYSKVASVHQRPPEFAYYG